MFLNADLAIYTRSIRVLIAKGLFSVLVTLTMLNMLIELMSSAYSSVVEHAEFEWLQEMAQILAEIQTLGIYWFDENRRNFPHVIHYLIPSDTLKKKKK